MAYGRKKTLPEICKYIQSSLFTELLSARKEAKETSAANLRQPSGEVQLLPDTRNRGGLALVLDIRS